MADFYYGTNAPNQTFYNSTSGNQPTSLNVVSPSPIAAPPVGYAPNAVNPTAPLPQQQTTQQVIQGSNTSYNRYTPYSAPRPFYAPPPAPPDYSQLNAQYQNAQRQTSINQAMKDYDKLSASTQALGFQSANNAGSIYAQRLMQQGINPLASGVVAAQAKLPVYQQLAGINAQRDQTRLDATNKAQTLAAQIAGQIASLKQSYAGMLADYNSRIGGYDLDLNKFNAQSGFQQEQLDQDTYFKQQQLAQQRAALLASTAASHGGSNSGVIPGSWRTLLAGTMGGVSGSNQQVSRAQLGDYLSLNNMWDQSPGGWAVV